MNENKKKKRGPQPKVLEQKQVNRINVYVTDDELHALKQRAGSLKVTEYLRSTALDRPIVLPIKVPEVNLDAVKELSRIGSNLNQIARQLNTFRSFDSDELTALASELRDSMAKLLGAEQ